MNKQNRPTTQPFTTAYTNGSPGPNVPQYLRDDLDDNVYSLSNNPPIPSCTQQQYTPTDDYQSRYNKYMLDLQYESERSKIQKDKEVAISKEKAEIRAVERQLKKIEFDAPFIHPADGSVCIETQNCMVQSPPMRMTNFCFPEILIIHHLGETDEKIYQFTCRIGQGNKNFFLSEKKCNSPSHILNKLMNIGGQINEDSESKRKVFIQKLFTMLINEHRKDVWIPDRKGWYKDKNGQIRFWKEAYTWESLIKLTK